MLRDLGTGWGFTKFLEALKQKSLRVELDEDDIELMRLLVVMQSAYDDSVAQAKNGDLEKALNLSFSAGFSWGMTVWKTKDPEGTSAIGEKVLKTLRKRRGDSVVEAYKSKLRAISELRRRHEDAPKATKTSHLKSMAKVEEGAQWGSYRALVDYCKEIKFGKDGK